MKRLRNSFIRPIATSDGRKLVTLKDAADYMRAMPIKKLDQPLWHTALDVVTKAINNELPVLIAGAAMHAALYPKDRGARPEPVKRVKKARKYTIIK